MTYMEKVRVEMQDVDKLVKRIQFYFKEVRVKEFMTSPIVTVYQNQIVLRAKKLMKLRRFSGIPVVDENECLVGIISIEDVIHALEEGKLNSKISDRMTKNVITLSKDDKITDVVKKFEVYGFGRFPVVEEKNHVIGIITKHDLMTILLSKLSILYVHDARREPFVHTENFRSSLTGVEVEKKSSEFDFNIDYADVSLAGTGAAKLKKCLLSKGFHPKFVKRVAIATYEAETNVIIHSGSNGKIRAYMEPEIVIVRVDDSGKGIENVKMAMHEGFSTAPDYVREMGFGAGMGLANIKRCSDRMMILSEPTKGVVIEMSFWRHEDECE